MPEFEPQDIESVAVETDHCHRCGAELGTREWDGHERGWCPDCELLFSRSPIPAVHVIVHDEESVLVLDEKIPQHEGIWSLPGGHVEPDEGPAEAVVRELEEESGLQADPEDLTFLTVYHVELPGVAFYFITYALERSAVSGELSPEFEGFEAEFLPIEEIRASPDQIRDSDLERIEMALDG